MFSYKFDVLSGCDDDLRLRIINNRRKAEISTKLRWTPDQLANALSDKPTAANVGKKKNLAMCVAKLESPKIQLAEEGKSNEDVKITREHVKEAVFHSTPAKEEKSTDNEYNFVKWYMEFAETHTTPGSKTKACYLHTLSRMRDYCGDLDRLDFADISVK